MAGIYGYNNRRIEDQDISKCWFKSDAFLEMIILKPKKKRFNIPKHVEALFNTCVWQARDYRILRLFLLDSFKHQLNSFFKLTVDTLELFFWSIVYCNVGLYLRVLRVIATHIATAYLRNTEYQ